MTNTKQNSVCDRMLYHYGGSLAQKCRKGNKMSVTKTFPCQWYAGALGTLFLFVKIRKGEKQ